MECEYIINKGISESDEDVFCASIQVANGEFVREGMTLFELEGSKAFFDLCANKDGFFYSFILAGENVGVGTIIGVISSEKIEESILLRMRDRKSSEIETQRDLSLLTNSDSHVNAMNWKAVSVTQETGKPLVLIGGGNGALQILNILNERNDYFLLGYFSDIENDVMSKYGMKKMGPCSEEAIVNFFSSNPGCAFAVTIGKDNFFRYKMFILLRNLGAEQPNFVHSTVVRGVNSQLGEGNIILANVYIGLNAKIGNTNIIGANSTIEHHNVIHDAVSTGPNFTTSGYVSIGSLCKIGAGVVVEPRIEIGERCVIASGVAILRSIEDNKTIKSYLKE